jgi:hypothetical protein
VCQICSPQRGPTISRESVNGGGGGDDRNEAKSAQNGLGLLEKDLHAACTLFSLRFTRMLVVSRADATMNCR